MSYICIVSALWMQGQPITNRPDLAGILGEGRKSEQECIMDYIDAVR